MNSNEINETTKLVNALIEDYDKKEGAFLCAKQRILDLIKESYENTKKYFPNHNPTAGHTFDTNIPTGSSFFYDWINIGNLMFFIKRNSTSLFAIKDGKNGAKIFTFNTNHKVGTYVTTTPIDSEKYKMVKCHGSLVASGAPIINRDETNIITMVLTPEEVDNKTVYVLASVYPGYADDSEYEDWEGISEGDILTGEELRKRGIARVKILE